MYEAPLVGVQDLTSFRCSGGVAAVALETPMSWRGQHLLSYSGKAHTRILERLTSIVPELRRSGGPLDGRIFGFSASMGAVLDVMEGALEPR